MPEWSIVVTRVGGGCGEDSRIIDVPPSWRSVCLAGKTRRGRDPSAVEDCSATETAGAARPGGGLAAYLDWHADAVPSFPQGFPDRFGGASRAFESSAVPRHPCGWRQVPRARRRVSGLETYPAGSSK